MKSGAVETADKPLKHIRVLDLALLLPGAMATRHLSDLGAEVIRIEPVAKQEPCSTDASHFPRDLRAADFQRALLNRNKRTLRIDLKQNDGRDLFRVLAAKSEVIVEGFRPGVVDRLGIGYDAIRTLNPRIVYCSISGYGQSSEHRTSAGHDINYLAMAGIADQTGIAGGPPALCNLQIADLLGGTFAAIMGILAALYAARSSGEGRHLDISMTDSIIANSVMVLATFLATGSSAPRGDDTLSGGVPCYGYYRTADDRYLAVGALEWKFWARLCEAVQRPDLKTKHLVRGEEARKVRAELERIFGAHPLAYWIQELRNEDCCVTPVRTFTEVLEEVGTRESDGAKGPVLSLKRGDIVCATSRELSPTEASADDVLGEVGYAVERIRALRSAGILG